MNERSCDMPGTWAMATVASFAAALALAVVRLVTAGQDAGLAYLSAGASVAGAGLMLVARRGGPAAGWYLAAAAVPAASLVLAAAPRVVALEAISVARWLVAGAALVAYLGTVRGLGARLKYGVCVGGLATAAVFFGLWEPPPPKAVPIARPLRELERSILQKVRGYTGQHRPLSNDIEHVLGADEYLNLELSTAQGDYRVLVFVTYNANAMSNIPHVPWVCMTQAGYRLVSIRQDDVPVPAIPGREIRANVILFEPGPGMGRGEALMFQYFNVGGTYECNRQVARILATTGAQGAKGSFLSQTQVAVWFMPTEGEDPTAKTSRPYQICQEFLNALVPLLEREHYPDLHGSEGG